jgi:hypothetical protein
MLLGAAQPAGAADRPFLEIDTAMVEDDDDHTFEFSTWMVKLKQERALQTSLEYNFNPTLSAELELGWSKNQEDGSRERSVELGLRKVWIDPAREGWGLGTNLSVGWARADNLGWKYRSVRTVVTYSLPIREKEVWLHANGGLEYLAEERRTRGIWAVGVHANVQKNVTLFSEFAQHAGGDALVNGGVRWWAKKDKVALDFSVGRARANGAESRGFGSLGLSFYDLGF